MHSFAGRHRRHSLTLQSPTATLIPLFSNSELTGLLDRKNRSDMCHRWESNPQLPACKASTLSTRPGSPLILNELFSPIYILEEPTYNLKGVRVCTLRYFRRKIAEQLAK